MSDRALSDPRRWRGSKWPWLLGALALLVVVLIARPVLHLLSNALDDQDTREALAIGHVDDASGLNATRVAEVWAIPTDSGRAEEQLRLLLRRAKEEGVGISIAGARHTMGGHTITPDGIVVDMLPFNAMRLGEDEGTLWVQAGARWSEVIPYLDRHDLSVAVMQSNNSFSVGGSLGANCHGWQHGRPPICDTVRSFRLMKADGSIVTCSRSQNRELFSLALGGYGLFGIILDTILEVVPNERYRMHSQLIDVDMLGETFVEHLKKPSVKMGYARLCVRSDQMFAQAIVNMLEAAPTSDGALPPLDAPGLQELKRTVFRSSAGSDYGKELRWTLEKTFGDFIGGEYFSRNQLLNEGVEIYADRSRESTDILHEYFVPHDALNAFLDRARGVLGAHSVDLLNVTVRDVRADQDTLLRYATTEMLALVMLFSQERTEAGETSMEQFTRALVDVALDLGGTYYLPYRLHPTLDQFRRAYPKHAEFFAAKRRHDPNELFQNVFYARYGH